MKNTNTSALVKFWNWLTSIFSTGVTAKLDDATDEAKRVVEDVIEDIEEAVEDVKSKVNETKRKVEEKVEEVIDDVKETIEDAVTDFKKGRFSDSEIADILLATGGKDPKSVDWKGLSKDLNRKIDALKSKAKSLNK